MKFLNKMVNNIDYFNEKRIFKHKIDEKINKFNLKRSSSELKTSKFMSCSLNNNNTSNKINDKKEDKLCQNSMSLSTGIVKRNSNQLNRSNSLVISTKTKYSDGSSDSDNSLNLSEKNSSHLFQPASKFKIEKSCNFNGNFSVEETETGIKIKIKQPHLISVTNNSCVEESSEQSIKANNNKTSIKIYPLKIGRTSIGSDINNDIILIGPGIEKEHCFIENIRENSRKNRKIKGNKENEASSKISLDNSVTIFPIAKLCSVDGVIIDTPYKLHTGTNFTILSIKK